MKRGESMSRNISKKLQHQIIHLLVEGNSCRSIRRLTGCHLKTVLRHLNIVGEGCGKLLDRQLRNLKLEHLQCDETWTFCRKKQGHLTDEEKRDDSIGDQFLYIAFDEKTKLIAAHRESLPIFRS